MAPQSKTKEQTFFQLGAEVQLFKADLVGMIDSESGGIIVRQPNAGVNAPGMSIQEFIDDIKNVFSKFGITAPDVNFPKTISKGVKLYLKEIYMLIQTKKPKSVEFAIWVSMDTTQDLRDMFPMFQIKSAYLKVWKTTRKVILDEMQITSIQSLLEEQPQPQQKQIEGPTD